MSYVIAEPCVATCDTACVDVCPIDCIHGPLPRAELAALPPEARKPGLQMYIDPDDCIDCGCCVGACPVEAIFHEDELPAQWAGYAELNRGFFR
jgi:NAD-dependent dihydropyrimidine dehydrogenase PreA subunit